MTTPITLVLGSLLILHVSLAQGKAQFRDAVDPCVPSPCGPGAECSVNSAGAAICRCQPGYFPKPDTITGCGPQCSQDYECRTTEKCQSNQCVPTCQGSPCGVNAECESVNHKAVCRCPRGYTGDPLFQCTQQAPIARAIISQPPPQAIIVRAQDPCSPSPCGLNAECRNSLDRPVCTCLPGHQGNPLTSCRRGECSSDSECPNHNVCENYHCVNPCANKCGANAHCDVRNHVAVCSCPPGYTGNPTTGCRRYDPNEACRACGLNTNCRVENERAICSCKAGYFGDPLTGCRHECESDYDCSGNLACIDFKCKNPCANACGTLANCEIRNHRAVCSCPKDYLGDPYTRCYPECTTHSECAPHLACIGLKCKDPCVGACGVGAECRVDKYNHKAICSCPKGFTGHPFTECRRQKPQDLCSPNPCGTNAVCRPGYDNSGRDRPVCTCPPGYIGDALVSCKRGECQTDSECSNNRICSNFRCEDPCRNSCGVNARCEARNHGAVCSCPPGYRGDPFTQCFQDPVRAKRKTKASDEKAEKTINEEPALEDKEAEVTVS
ncbi:unnamed protein product [Orchesella dallaii]|uniref:EGF-like domain-containing protein n=1 Tax=Orchesella dallaii TaxID=48710 RepID=A0ABP1Q1Y2_9HEXA